MTTVVPSDLSLEEMRTILAAARAQGWRAPTPAPKDARKHVLADGVCVRCGQPPRTWDADGACRDYPVGGRMTDDEDARTRALGRPAEPLPRVPVSAPLPGPRSVLRLNVPGRVGTGPCEHGCDAYAVHVACLLHG